MIWFLYERRSDNFHTKRICLLLFHIHDHFMIVWAKHFENYYIIFYASLKLRSLGSLGYSAI